MEIQLKETKISSKKLEIAFEVIKNKQKHLENESKHFFASAHAAQQEKNNFEKDLINTKIQNQEFFKRLEQFSTEDTIQPYEFSDLSLIIASPDIRQQYQQDAYKIEASISKKIEDAEKQMQESKMLGSALRNSADSLNLLVDALQTEILQFEAGLSTSENCLNQMQIIIDQQKLILNTPRPRSDFKKAMDTFVRFFDRSATTSTMKLVQDFMKQATIIILSKVEQEYSSSQRVGIIN